MLSCIKRNKHAGRIVSQVAKVSYGDATVLVLPTVPNISLTRDRAPFPARVAHNDKSEVPFRYYTPGIAPAEHDDKNQILVAH